MPKLPSAADLAGGRPGVPLLGGVNAARPGPVPNVADGGAAGMVELGRALQGAGDQVFKVFEREQQRADTMRAEDAFNQLRERQLDLSLGKENGFANLRGGDAANGDLLGKWSKRFGEEQKRIESTLGNDRQREAFRQRSATALAGFQGDILRHVAQQTDVYALSVYKGTLDTETRNAMANWSDPQAIATSLERINNAVTQEADRSGWSPEAAAAARMQAASGVHATVIAQALVNENAAYAQRYYAANKDSIDPSVAKTLANAVKDGAQKELANGFQARYITDRNNPRGLEVLEEEVAKSSLDQDRKNALMGRIGGRRDTLEAKALVAHERQLRLIQRQIDGVNNITLAGYEPSSEQILDVLSAARGTELEPQVRQMIATSNATREFRAAPPQAQEAAITALERAARKDPTKFDVTVVQRFKSIHDNQRTAARDDPITFAVRQGFVDQEDPAVQPLNLSDPTQIGEGLRARAALARGVAARYAVQPKLLTDTERQALGAVLKSATAAQKQEYFGGLANALGSDYEGYKALMAQIAPDDPVTAHAGIMAGRGRMAAHAGLQLEPGQANSVAQLILAGQAVLHPARKDDGSPEKGKLWPMPPEVDMDTLFKAYERDAFAGNAAARNGFYQTAKAIYAARSVEAGDSSAEMDTDRWEEAMLLATGGVVQHNSRAVVLPWGMSEGQFKDQLTRRIEDVEAAGRLSPTVDAARLKGMPVRAVGDGRYVFQAGDGVLVDRDNQPILIDFNVSPAFRTSGFGATPKGESALTQWRLATGGVLRAGENEEQALQRWLGSPGRTLGNIKATPSPSAAPSTLPTLPGPGMTGVRG